MSERRFSSGADRPEDVPLEDEEGDREEDRRRVQIMRPGLALSSGLLAAAGNGIRWGSRLAPIGDVG